MGRVWFWGTLLGAAMVVAACVARNASSAAMSLGFTAMALANCHARRPFIPKTWVPSTFRNTTADKALLAVFAVSFLPTAVLSYTGHVPLARVLMGVAFFAAAAQITLEERHHRMVPVESAATNGTAAVPLPRGDESPTDG